MIREVISLFEKFIKDNNLIINDLSAKEFCELYENNYDISILSDEYIELGNTYKTKNAKFNCYKKAYLVNPDNVISKVLMYGIKRNKITNIVSIKDIPYSKYKNNVDYITFLNDEINELFKYLLTNNIYNPKDDIDLYDLGYKARQYLWLLRTLYYDYISLANYKEAIRIGEKILGLNKSDSYEISYTLPYLYIYLNDIDSATLLINKSNGLALLLLNSVISFLNNNINVSIRNLKEIYKANPKLIELITINTNINTFYDYMKLGSLYEEAILIYAGYILMGDELVLKFKEFVINNLNHIDEFSIEE